MIGVLSGCPNWDRTGEPYFGRPKGAFNDHEDDIRLFRGILTGVVITACGSAIIWLGFVSLR